MSLIENGDDSFGAYLVLRVIELSLEMQMPT